MTRPTIARALDPENLTCGDVLWVWWTPDPELFQPEWHLAEVEDGEEYLSLHFAFAAETVPVDTVAGAPAIPVERPEGTPRSQPALPITVTDGAMTAIHDFLAADEAAIARITRAVSAAISEACDRPEGTA